MMSENYPIHYRMGHVRGRLSAKQAKKVIDQRVKHYTGRLKQALQNVRAVEASRGVVKWRKVGRGMSVALSDWVPSEAAVEPDNVPTLQPEESDHD